MYAESKRLSRSWGVIPVTRLTARVCLLEGKVSSLIAILYDHYCLML